MIIQLIAENIYGKVKNVTYMQICNAFIKTVCYITFVNGSDCRECEVCYIVRFVVDAFRCNRLGRI